MKLLLIIFSLLTLNLSFADGDETPANASQCDTDRGNEPVVQSEDSPETGGNEGIEE